MKRALLIIVSVFLLLMVAGLIASREASKPLVDNSPERVSSFKSRMKLNLDGRVTVVEEFLVKAEGILVKRGVVKGLPYSYSDYHQRTYTARYKVGPLFRDGVKQDFPINEDPAGLKLALGTEMPLSKGVHSYVVQYDISSAINRADGRDRFFWVCTGGSVLPLDSSEIEISLPPAVQKEATLEAAAGYLQYLWDKSIAPEDSAGILPMAKGNVEVKRGLDGNFSVRTKRPLLQGEVVTILITVPSGIIRLIPPTPLTVETENTPEPYISDDFPLQGSAIPPSAAADLPSPELPSGDLPPFLPPVIPDVVTPQMPADGMQEAMLEPAPGS